MGAGVAWGGDNLQENRVVPIAGGGEFHLGKISSLAEEEETHRQDSERKERPTRGAPLPPASASDQAMASYSDAHIGETEV